ncbi:MFS transporter [Pontiella sulfatireligans]|uniref:L-fucose-proton symporter n=1 Tax=Pontiella sulfatireligans TaxID=2750658 RepID=A0A6C2UGR3_9BACT|nr:MFS transporter [Pontiella sulfatireligans]VGO18396.1 L-fucose-proton symporter [Pontiella sulfatireligans]
MKLKTLPIFMAFVVMGVADAMGPLSDAVKTQYELSNVMATMLSFFVFIAFAAFSVPGGLLASRIGMKKLLLLGLGLNAVAMLVPSLMVPGFGLLLTCIFVLGIGTTFLQVAGNPIMRDVSAEGAFSRNLSFAQGFKGLGSTLATYLVTAISAIALFNKMGWRGTFPVFFVLMAVAFIFVSLIKVEESKPEVPPSVASSLRLLKEPVFAMAVLGIFLYVGAEVCMARFLFPSLKEMGMDEATAGKFGPALFFLLLTIGRIGGGVALAKVKPRPAFRVSALMGVVGVGLLMTGNTSLAIGGVILGGLGFANIWPLLFSITVEEKPERAGELSGLMCMAISGGALVPLVMGGLVDAGMNAISFVVPLVCFIYLFVLSLKGGKVTV